VTVDWTVFYLFSPLLFSRHAVRTKRGERVYYCVNIALIVTVINSHLYRLFSETKFSVCFVYSLINLILYPLDYMGPVD
jgi:hypothetical protein